MSITASKLSRQLTTIADAWVTDPFRPNLQLGTFLKSLAQHPGLTPQAVRAARALKDNEAKNSHPLSNNMLQPPSMPQHYDRLVEGYEKSAQGVGRPWWKVFFGIW